MDFASLDDISQKCLQLQEEIDKERDSIADIWEDMFVAKQPASRAETFTRIVTNAIAIYDGFMLVRKLNRRFGTLVPFFSRKRK